MVVAEKKAPVENALRVTLIANTGLLLQYRGYTLLLDGIYGREGHPFSNLPPEVWERMILGQPPFERIDYLLFSHAHPDHFSPEMTMEFLKYRKVKGVFLPDSHKVGKSGLGDFLRERRIPCVLLSQQTDHASFRVESEISVRAISTLHLDKQFQKVHHSCYLLSFGDKQVLFTADVDYTQETFERIGNVPLRAAFVNPLFFSALRRGRYFQGELNAQTICIYHVPFSEDDAMRMRPVLAHDLVEWPPEKHETVVLCDAFQHIDL